MMLKLQGPLRVMLFLSIVLLTAGQASSFSVEIITPGNLPQSSSSSLTLSGPAVDLAVEELRDKYAGKFDIRQTYLINRSYTICDDLVGGIDYLVADYYYRRTVVSNVTVFILPGCLLESVAIARLAAAWDQLVIFSAYTNFIFRNRRFYPNVIQAAPVTARPIIDAYCSFIRRYQWNIIYVISDRAGSNTLVPSIGVGPLGTRLRASGSTVYTVVLDSSVDGVFDLVLAKIASVARVVSFWGHALALRKLMIAAHHVNMTGSEYVYLFLVPYEYPTWAYGNATWQNYDEYDQVALLAYQSVFFIAPTPTLTVTGEKRRERLLTDLVERTKMGYNYTYAKDVLPTPTILALYASVQIFGQVLERFWLKNPSKLVKSAVLANEISGHTFNTSAGAYSFDDAGERIVRFDVQQLVSSTGRFEPVLRQDPGKPDEFTVLREIVWLGGNPPSDRPECGFSGFGGPCARADGGIEIALIVCAVVGAALVIALILWLRARRNDKVLMFSRFHLQSVLVLRRDSSHC